MPGPDVGDKLFKMLSSSFDDELGGFGGAPKFPQPGMKACANFNSLDHLQIEGAQMCHKQSIGLLVIGSSLKKTKVLRYLFLFHFTANFVFLFKYYQQKKPDEDGKRALHMCLRSLECIDKGGIHDHVGQVSYHSPLF